MPASPKSNSKVSARVAVESIASRVSAWFESRCREDRDCAFGNVYETMWSKEITTLLTQIGFQSEHQRRYPESRKTCDVVAALPEDKELWLEIKGAWLTSQHRTDSCGRVTFLKNSVFRKHLFNPQESTLKDVVEKLPRVIASNVIGAVLLFGYDSYGCTMDAAINELVEQAGVGRKPWTELYREWQNAFDGRYRIRCWFWYQ